MSEPNDLAATPSGPSSAVQIGEQLRRAREQHGSTLADIAQTLKLSQRQVAALESGDWTALPGQTFIRGFVRNYVRLLGMAPDHLKGALDLAFDKPVDTLQIRPVSTTEMPRERASSGRDRWFVMVGLGVALVSVIAYVLLPEHLSALRESAQSIISGVGKTPEPPVVAVQAEPVPAAEPLMPPGATPQQVLNPQVAPVAMDTPAAPPTSPAVVPSPLSQALVPPPAPVIENATQNAAATAESAQLRIVFTKDSWVEVREREGKVIFSQRLAGGVERQLSGKGPLTLHIGNAPGVEIYWRGQAVDLAPHSRGNIARLVLE